MADQSRFGSVWLAMFWPLPLVLVWLAFWSHGGRRELLRRLRQLQTGP
jgi:hypothetical protein